jgi:hypothetical protein
MPGRSGIDILKELDAQRYDAPIFIISAQGDIPLAVDAIKHGAFDFIEKPFAPGAVVERVRAAHKGAWKATEGFSLTYLPFIARAFCDVVHEYPHVNASVEGETLVVHRDVNLGIAVDLDYQGLLVPVVRDADTKRLRAIAGRGLMVNEGAKYLSLAVPIGEYQPSRQAMRRLRPLLATIDAADRPGVRARLMAVNRQPTGG